MGIQTVCSFVPKALRIVLVNLTNDRPGRPGFVSWGWHAQSFNNLLFPLVPVGDEGFDVVRAIFNDGPMARVKSSVLGLPFCESLIIVVHFLEAGHVRPKILENRGPIAENCVCREESLVEWEVNSDGVGGVTGREEDVDGGEIGVCGVALIDGHW